MGQSIKVLCCASRDGEEEHPNVACSDSTRTPRTQRVVLGRYVLHLVPDAWLGAGTSSTCHRGFDLLTGKHVAIKMYRARELTPERHSDSLLKFRRQVEVLKELMAPFETPSDETLQCGRLAQTNPGELFMELLDYSRDASGQAGPDPVDGNLYVVSELAQCSLDDHIKDYTKRGRSMPQGVVRNIAKNLMLVVAGLHAKNLVHLDLKPSNLLIFDGVLKLIDFDGCLRTGSTVRRSDGTVSFSPVYCAPEWAAKLLRHEDIVVTPALDVWSVGLMLCELVVGKPVLAKFFARFHTPGRSYQDARCSYLEWLNGIKSPPIPASVHQFDAQLYQLLADNMLAVDPSKRMSLAQSLRHSYVRRGSDLSTCDAGGPRVCCLEAVEHRCHSVVFPIDNDVIHKGVPWTSQLGAEVLIDTMKLAASMNLSSPRGQREESRLIGS